MSGIVCSPRQTWQLIPAKLRAMYTRMRLAVSRHMRQQTLVAAGAAIMLAIIIGLATVKLGSFQHQVKALVIVLAGVALAIAAVRPDYGLVILVALIPFEFAFFGTNSATVLLWTLPYVMVWRIRFSDVPSWVIMGGLTLLAGSLISDLGAHDKGIATEGSVAWLGTLVVLCVAFTVFHRRKDASRGMIDIFTAQAVIIVIFGLLQQAGSDTVVGSEYNAGHPNSFFSYYTIYAGYLAMVATLVLGEILVALGERLYARVWVLGGALVFILVGLAGAASRGGLLALGTGWLMLAALNIRRGSIVVRIGLVVLLVGGIAYLTTPKSTLVTIEHRITTSNGSLSEDKTRFALQKAGEAALQAYPLGLGYGNFQFYLAEDVRSSKIRLRFFHAQEVFVQVGLDAGWIGLAGFLILLSAPIIAAFRCTSSGSTVIRATAFAAALGGFIAQGLYDYVLWDAPFLIFFAAMIWGVMHSLQFSDERRVLRVDR
jgi:O-Antigen ligase